MNLFKHNLNFMIKYTEKSKGQLKKKKKTRHLMKKIKNLML